ncbi:hypothetical protein PABG_02097 [Paracoccidioides brasiliensis Pb03]|nr:hypothetical protein PABG_02097 [Paracoccidioides brasiliensis Pb03]
MFKLFDERHPYTYNLAQQTAFKNEDSQHTRRHDNMAGIPTIELYSPEEYRPHCYATVSPYPCRAPLDPPISIFTDPAEKRIKKSKSESRIRKSFWSKLKKSKSENQRPHSEMLSAYSRSDFQQGEASVKLTWSDEHNMWTFPSASASTSPRPSSERYSSPQKEGWSARDVEYQKKYTLPASQATKESDKLLFAQIPGHYPLSLYDSVNNNDSLPTYTCGRNFGDVATRTGTESQWTLVAKRVCGSASVR